MKTLKTVLILFNAFCFIFIDLRFLLLAKEGNNESSMPFHSEFNQFAKCENSFPHHSSDFSSVSLNFFCKYRAPARGAIMGILSENGNNVPVIRPNLQTFGNYFKRPDEKKQEESHRRRRQRRQPTAMCCLVHYNNAPRIFIRTHVFIITAMILGTLSRISSFRIWTKCMASQYQPDQPSPAREL